MATKNSIEKYTKAIGDFLDLTQGLKFMRTSAHTFCKDYNINPQTIRICVESGLVQSKEISYRKYSYRAAITSDKLEPIHVTRVLEKLNGLAQSYGTSKSGDKATIPATAYALNAEGMKAIKILKEQGYKIVLTKMVKTELTF